MAAPTSKTTIAQKLDYTFRDESLLDLALTAAGAKEENYDGNRTLAQIGKAFVDLVSTKMGYISGTNPETNFALKYQLSSNKRCAGIAKAIGLSEIMTFNPRSGPHSPKTLNKAINALIGAVYVDCDCNKTTISVLEHLKWFSPSYQSDNVAEVQSQILQPAVISEPSAPTADESLHYQPDVFVCPHTAYEQRKQFRIADIESKTGLDLESIFEDIVGPNTIASLRSQVYSAVHASRDNFYPSTAYLSPTERYAVIQKLGEDISLMNMIRNSHILQLFQECGGNESGYVLTAEDFNCGARKPGNPIHRQDTEITLRMMALIFPDTAPNKDSSTFNKIKQLRREGKRLDSLVRHFGIGILGLMYNQEGPRGTKLAHVMFV